MFFKKRFKRRRSGNLDENDSRFLLKLARDTINATVRGNEPPQPELVAHALEYDIPAFMRERRGVFVSLHSGGALRGCIGHIIGVMPMLEGIVENAVAAAFKDPRFRPLEAGDLENVDIEISILSPLEKVASTGDIEIPGQGVVMTKDGAKAVFLPQVAEEQGWDRDTLLCHLSRKAGLDADAWRDGAEFEIFTAESVRET